MLIYPEASSAQNSMAAVSADGSTVCVLILRLNSSCSRSIALVVRTLRHWLGGRRVKVNKRSPASSRLSATARCLSLHLDEGLAARLDLLRRHCVDHAVVIRSDLVMQPLGGMCEQVPVLVDRAARSSIMSCRKSGSSQDFNAATNARRSRRRDFQASIERNTDPTRLPPDNVTMVIALLCVDNQVE